MSQSLYAHLNIQTHQLFNPTGRSNFTDDLPEWHGGVGGDVINDKEA